ncbi:MAG: helix-turn-helix domain-containing protein [Acidobacteriota bacterium]
MSASRDGKARVIALAGSKGGVGTSLLAANLAIHLARQGRAVVLVDAAPGGAALHALVGMDPSPGDLEAWLAPEPPPLEEMLLTGAIPNLRLLAGLADDPSCAPVPEDLTARVLQAAGALACDFVIADIGSGRTRATRLACRAATNLFLVTTPEPESLRSLLRLQAAVLHAVLYEALGSKQGQRCTAPFRLQGLRGVLAQLGERSNAYANLVSAIRSRHFGLILNQVRTTADTHAATHLGAVLAMLQAVVVDPVVNIEYDLCAHQAVSEGRVLSQRYPNAPVIRGLEKVSFSLQSTPSPRVSPDGERYAPLSAWNHYRLLALDPRASPQEIQKHYEWIRTPFQAGGLAEAVASREHLDPVQSLVEAAYRTLIFLESRREYDRGLVEAGVLDPSELRELEIEAETAAGRSAGPSQPDARPAAAHAPSSPAAGKDETSRPVPASKKSGHTRRLPERNENEREAGRDQRYSGILLRSLRQQRRLDIDRIAAITKIRSQQIEAIESERYQDLPVPVFLRGFLRAYAGCLDLDPEEVVRDYMEGYEAAARERL